ncbi:MAG: thioredoxin family protein [Bacteroidales bacterium]|nr:thioredoxin family protein [Bacteroidales bacterium]
MEEEKLFEADKLAAFLQKEKAAVLYFYNDHCPPCLALRPKIQELISLVFPEMKLLWVNSGSGTEVPARFNVFVSPVIIIFFEGKEFRRFSKYISVNEVSEAVSRPYKILFGDQRLSRM